MDDDQNRSLSFHRPSKHEMARFIAVATGVVALFGLVLWSAQ